ncbi:MAG: glycosyltransferase domain-containing protein [Leifsonia sp.]
MTPPRAVFTALLGPYEDLSEQPVAKDTDIPFICFTDRDDLESETWTVVRVDLPFPFDLVRSQRFFKILGHPTLDEYDETLYIDNSVRLEATPDAILDYWLDGADFALHQHSFRDRVIDEFDEIVRLNYDDAGRVNEQLLHYAEAYPDVLLERPYWNGMLARRRTPEVAATMRIWYDHVLRYSRRDQLSANVAFSVGPVMPRTVGDDNNTSEWHTWPVDVKRRATLTLATGRRTGPLLAEVARLEREVSAERRRADDLVAGAEEAAERARVAELELAEAEARLVRAEERFAGLISSFSWRASKPIRVVGARVRRLRSGGSTD